MRKLTVFIGVVALGMTVGASVAGAGPSGDLKRFCKANVALDAAPEGPSPRLLERYRTTAPPEIAETVDSAVTTFEELGEGAFEDEAFLASLREIDQFVLDNCDYERVDVTMEDFAFSGIPSEVEKGTVAFNLVNEGAELHEFVLVRLKGDAALDDLLELPEDATDDDFAELASEVRGGGFAAPGESDLALVNFKRTGNYAALCFIPVGTTSEETEGTGPPHFIEGMAAEFEVTS
ncbi:MAG: hypothetical protein ACRDY6_10980 [Acidimicrobiia bacterium]